MNNSPQNGGPASQAKRNPEFSQLGMFAKYWEPGRVKTRLAGSVGSQTAAELCQLFVMTLLRRFATTAQRRVLCFWPPEVETEMKRVAVDWSVSAQSEGDLGQRMRRYFDQAFADGQQRVVLIGSDSPNLPRERVFDAFKLLASHDVVIGQTPDGGYYLIGLSRPCPEVFANVPWSTAKVWEHTMENVRQANLTHAVLEPWYDVDELDDLYLLQADLLTADEPELVTLRTGIARLLVDFNPSDA